jgi:hypothetical protein
MVIHKLIPQHAPLWAVIYSPRRADGRLWAQSTRIDRVVAWTLADEEEDGKLVPVVAADRKPHAHTATGEDVHEVYGSGHLAEARARDLAPSSPRSSSGTRITSPAGIQEFAQFPNGMQR